MNLSDLKVGDRFIVAGVRDEFTFRSAADPVFKCFTAVGDRDGLTFWTYDAECDLYDSPA